MLTLTLRTDKPDAEIGLFKDHAKLAYLTWAAHRQLAETIHIKIKELLDSHNYELNDLESILIFKGPGSFTGLRIGMSVGNALAYSLQIPILAVGGADWLENGCRALEQGQGGQIAMPEYGSPPHITVPKR
jgi:tRNA threonylcarbamoyladenosine biosynthesis protein TsaB